MIIEKLDTITFITIISSLIPLGVLYIYLNDKAKKVTRDEKELERRLLEQLKGGEHSSV